ncbi:hypothetical protein ON010_g14218 [Phytophthora cinnamomi]|nr:hypothetical protein ON010_g14218 [Phytophthora cinnamomi]
MNGPGEKKFKRLWRELTATGWKERKPKGFSVDYSYVKPGVAGRLDVSKMGVDFFVGVFYTGAFVAGHVAYSCCFPAINNRRRPSTYADNGVTRNGSLLSRKAIVHDVPERATPSSLRCEQLIGLCFGGESDDTDFIVLSPTELAVPVLAATELPVKASSNYDQRFIRSQPYDDDAFLDALPKDTLFGTTVSDDINLCFVDSTAGSASNGEGEDVIVE